MRTLNILAASMLALASPSFAGGAKPAGNIVAAAVTSPDHKTLVAAVKAAGLVDTLASKGPFTVFAPTDAAFAKLPAGTVDTLLQPANRETLASVLTYHVVAGKVSASDLIAKINASGGAATLTTVQGGNADRQNRRRQGHDRRCQGRRGYRGRSRHDAIQRDHPRHRRSLNSGLKPSRKAMVRPA